MLGEFNGAFAKMNVSIFVKIGRLYEIVGGKCQHKKYLGIEILRKKQCYSRITERSEKKLTLPLSIVYSKPLP
jgi:hypothetical protein